MAKSIKVKSPGRINIIGEHTDYNMGYVLPAAIDKHTIMEVKLNETVSTVHMEALNLKDSFSYDHQIEADKAKGWQNYLVGVVEELKKLGANIKGFDAKFEGTVPIGSGMSSSASLECSLAFALNEAFDLGLETQQLIKACQMAEHNYVGTKCGIMDQYASMMGKKDQVILLNCGSLESKYFTLNLRDYELLLLNTNVSHNLSTSAYNQRREECQYGLKIFQQTQSSFTSLSDGTLSELKTIKKNMPDTIYRRCHHVLSENQRVLEACKAMQSNDFDTLGQLIYASHKSLTEDYEVSCAELDFLVDQSKPHAKILGSRMMGGGFGGCTINLIHKNFTAQYIDEVSVAYKGHFDIDLSPYKVSIEDGTHLVK